MPDLEQIIRPFVVKDVTPPVSPQTADTAAADAAKLAIGNATNPRVETTSGSFSISYKKYMTAIVKEVGAKAVSTTKTMSMTQGPGGQTLTMSSTTSGAPGGVSMSQSITQSH